MTVPIIGYTRRGQPVYPIAGGAGSGNIVTRSDAGALMPEEVSREIIQQTVRGSAALQLFRRVTVGRAQHRMPALQSFPAAYWVGGDTGLKQTTKQQWFNRYINIAELAAIVPVSQAVFDDQDYDMWGEVQPRVAEAMGEVLDAAIFFGVNIPSEWAGVVGIKAAATTAGNTVTRGAGQDLGIDISNAMGTVEDDGFDVNGFAGPRRLKARLRNVRSSTSGMPIFQELTASTGGGVIYGEPYAVISNAAWTPTDSLAILGDFTQGIVGIRQDMSYKVFTEGVISDDSGNVVLNLMQQDSIALRAVMRVGYVTANPITPQKPTYTDTSRFPFAVLLDA